MLERDLILSIITVVFSLLIGSFLNVVIVRLPRQMHWQWEKDEQGAAPPPGIAWPPSHCPSCEHALSWWENLPLLSYLLLRGRCRACRTGISLRYPLVEALTALLSLVVVLILGPQWSTVAALVLTWALIALAFIDLEHFLLPDRITLPLLAVGLLVNTIGGFTDLLSALIGAVSGYGILWAVYHAYRALTGREGFGYGDFKLLGALGAWLGWQLLQQVAARQGIDLAREATVQYAAVRWRAGAVEKGYIVGYCGKTVRRDTAEGWRRVMSWRCLSCGCSSP